MEGWAELFKHFFSSKLSSAALLITSSALVFGRHYNSAVPEVPGAWLWLVTGVMIFTAVQCVWWIAVPAVSGVDGAFRRAIKRTFPLKLDDLSRDENTALQLMAAAAEGYAIRTVLCNSQGFTELIAGEVAVDSLIARGLMQTTKQGYLIMTDEGRRFVLANRGKSATD